VNKKIFIVLFLIVALTVAGLLLFTKTHEEKLDAASRLLEPPIGCPLEKVEEVFGKHVEVRPHVIQGKYFSALHYDLKPYDNFSVLLVVVYADNKVLKSNICLYLQMTGAPSRFQPIQSLEDQLRRKRADIKFQYTYQQAINLNYDVYGAKLDILKSQKWEEPILEGLLDLPEIKGSYLTEGAPLSVDLYIKENGDLFVHETQIEIASLKEELTGIKKLAGDGTICNFYVDKLAKVDCRLIDAVQEVGLSRVHFFGFNKDTNMESYCSPIYFPGPPPSGAPPSIDLLIKLSRIT
jgi:hypothetical protein